MRRAGAVLAVLLVALVAAGLSHSESLRPLTLQSSEQSDGLYGLVQEQAAPPRLVEVDPATMNAAPRRSVRLGTLLESVGSGWSFSPDRGALAIAVHSPGSQPRARLRLVALPSLRRIAGTIPVGEGWAGPLAWVSRSTLVGLVGRAPARFFVADLARRRVVSSRLLAGEVLATERAGDRLVALFAPNYRIGPVELAVADASGGVRSVTLDRVVGGHSHEDPAQGVPEYRIPGLAVDVHAGRAFVFPAESLAAEIDLNTLAVSYHEPSAPVSAVGRLGAWLQPAAEAKLMRGPSRHARWLGDGLVALTGRDHDLGLDDAGQPYDRSTPAGLSIIDVRSWTIREVDPGATWTQPAADLLLATGETMGFAAYDSDLRKRFHLFRGSPAWVHAAYGGRAYLRVSDQPSVTIVDLQTGATLGERFGQLPQLLVD
jgi:hypothetical protein